MSDLVEKAVTLLNERIAAGAFAGTAKFDILEEGQIMLDSDGARAGDEEAAVTLRADAETFQSILEGDTNPTSAFMSGQLEVDGDMGMAMQLASALA
ncbi:MAG: SCP2 sterol-binding domain-containing protein [Pseudomonadota bacterium]